MNEDVRDALLIFGIVATIIALFYFGLTLIVAPNIKKYDYVCVVERETSSEVIELDYYHIYEGVFKGYLISGEKIYIGVDETAITCVKYEVVD